MMVKSVPQGMTKVPLLDLEVVINFVLMLVSGQNLTSAVDKSKDGRHFNLLPPYVNTGTGKRRHQQAIGNHELYISRHIYKTQRKSRYIFRSSSAAC